ncbi:MAG: Rossmann-fold NAD(P)-binding domain-containing protein [Candidatus Helarchaeales archaeon]
MINHLIIGRGEIGLPLSKILQAESYDIKDGEKTIKKYMKEEIKFLHVCFRHSNDFRQQVIEYVKKLNPKCLVIHSTVPSGTTFSLKIMLKIPCLYSPVRGKHPNMEKDIRKWTKWIAYEREDEKWAQLLAEAFEKEGINTRLVEGTKKLELAKIYETTYLGWLITFFQELKRNYPFESYETICNFLEDTGYKVFRRAGIIDNEDSGKHCITENIKFIVGVIPETIKKSNEKRKKELS